MTFLPILERELRLQARNRANYWGRMAVVAVGVLVCAPPWIWSGPFATPSGGGRAAFEVLVSAAFLLCCGACLLTADTISSERRQGTLGLLLLTRVKHIDVLLGKLGSRGLASLLVLVSFQPVLILPLLAGGVTGGEAARTAGALEGALLLSLSIGFWASARGFERFRTARAALLVLAGLVVVPWVLALLIPRTHASIASPLGTVAGAADIAYKTSPIRYWLSLACVHAFAGAFLWRAAVGMRRRASDIQDEASDRKLRTRKAGNYGAFARRDREAEASLASSQMKCHYCGRPNLVEAGYCCECGTGLHAREVQRKNPWTLSSAATPLHWLIGRQHGLKTIIWAAALISFFHFGLFGMASRFIALGGGPAVFAGISWGFSFVTTAITGALFAWAASRFFIEAQRTGELELLLTTPLGAGQIVSTHWEILKRMVRLPVLVMLTPVLFQMLVVLPFGYSQPGPWRIYYVTSVFLGSVNIIFSVAACCWLAAWFALAGRGQARTILGTVVVVKGLPYVLTMTWSMFYGIVLAWFRGAGNAWTSVPFALFSLLPQTVILLYYVWLLRLARRHLLHARVTIEPFDLQSFFSGALQRVKAGIRRARRWP